MWISGKIWAAFQATLELERARVKYYQDKCNELNSALLKGAAQTVVRLPAAPLTPAPNVPVLTGPHSVEPSDVWANRHGWFGEQRIATPPIEREENS